MNKNDLLAEAIALLRDIAPELQAEADQREFGGNDEDFAGMRALSNRANALLAQFDQAASAARPRSLSDAHIEDERGTPLKDDADG